MKTVRTRFAPSPTGDLHIGGARTALFNFLYAKKHGGTFILRLEDTDRERYVEGSIESIQEGLSWLGIEPDEGFGPGRSHEPYVQSKRLALYEKYANQLIDDGKAYYCFCSQDVLDDMRKKQQKTGKPPKYDRRCLSLSQEDIQKKLEANEPYVIRLKIPEGETVFKDVVYGEIKIPNESLDDQVLIKSDGFPTYHLANVVDDHDMEITHVIRGEEWIPSTPKHILLYKALGWEPPIFAHLPIFLTEGGKKMSKREGDMSLLAFKQQGYLADAVKNFIALLGWNPKSEQEFFSGEELIKAFDLAQVNRANPIFDREKLDWMNSEYIRNLDLTTLLELTKPYLERPFPKGKEKAAMAMFQERLKRLNEISGFAAFLFELEDYNPTLLVWKKTTLEDTIESLSKVEQFIGSLSAEQFEKGELEKVLKLWIQENELKNGPVLWPLRVALSGKEGSPSPFEIMEVLGKKESLNRIKVAEKKLDTLR